MIRTLLILLIPTGLLSSMTLFSCENGETITEDPIQFDSVLVQNFTYHVQTEDTLKINLYQKSNEIKPLVLFVHGGGFMGGSYNHPFVAQFCDSLAQTGVHVASMSYRLTLKGQTFDCDQTIENKISAFTECVNDIRLATNYCLKNAARMNLDSNIILCGSSAGAEAGVHQIYWEHDFLKGAENPLDPNFTYSAFISMAGAITDTTLMETSSAIPTLFFHGACDPLVPICSNIHRYCEANEPGALMLHGSISMSQRLASLRVPHWTIIECGGDHSIANRAMTDYFGFIAEFVEKTFSDELKETRVEIIENGTCDEIFCPVCD